MVIRQHDQDTIAAISTPLGSGGIGVVRMSGSDSLAIADKIFKSVRAVRPSTAGSHRILYGWIYGLGSANVESKVDEVLLSVMRGPKTYTCEDVVEISCHGSLATLQTVLEACLSAGARLAAPGEFTKRAYLNGRIDLLQAEAVLELVGSANRSYQQSSLSNLDGAMSRLIAGIRVKLIDVMAHLEAEVDFPEDEPEIRSQSESTNMIAQVLETLRQLLATQKVSYMQKNGARCVIFGRPNVGKSSILNALCHKPRAIVSEIPGTTRDTLEEMFLVSGVPVIFVDTAGIRDSQDVIEQQGVLRARQSLATADLGIFVVEAPTGLTAQDQQILAQHQSMPIIMVANKVDKGKKLDMDALKKQFGFFDCVYTSCIPDPFIEPLNESIENFFRKDLDSLSVECLIQTKRQRLCLESMVGCLEQAMSACEEGLSSEFIAADVRRAMESLGELTGDVRNDEILDSLFGQFCIGK